MNKSDKDLYDYLKVMSPIYPKQKNRMRNI